MQMQLEHDGKTYALDMDEIEAHELRVVEQHSGMTYPEWMEGLQRGKVDALVAIVFTAKRRAGDTVEWADLDNMKVLDLLKAMAEANGLDLEALERGETPELPAALNRAARRASSSNGNGAGPKRPPAKRPTARK